jgi:hypothetical protein
MFVQNPSDDQQAILITTFNNFTSAWNKFVDEVNLALPIYPKEDYKDYYSRMVYRKYAMTEIGLVTDNPMTVTKHHYIAILITSWRLQEIIEPSSLKINSPDVLLTYYRQLIKNVIDVELRFNSDGGYLQSSRKDEFPLLYDAIYLAKHFPRSKIEDLLTREIGDFKDFFFYLDKSTEKSSQDSDKFLLLQVLGGGVIAMVVFVQYVLMLGLFAVWVVKILLACIIPLLALFSYNVSKDPKVTGLKKDIAGVAFFILAILSVIWFINLLQTSGGNYSGDCYEEGPRIVCS